MRDAPRTAPLRAASAELTPARERMPAACLNCGTPVSSNYCPECGQHVIDPDPTLRELGQEMAAGFLNWDGKLLGTLRLLVTSPGTLTQEYLAGRRVRFISPLRVYLTCSFLFFFVKAVLPAAPLQISSAAVAAGKGSATTATSTQIGVITVTEDNESESLEQLDRLAKTGDGIGRAWGRHFAAALRNKEKLSASVTANLPRVMFVLVPLFAALVALVFRRRRMRYPQHLAFALHVHAFLFLALLPTLVPRIVKVGSVGALCVLVSFTLIALHLVFATRRVYEVSMRVAIARSGLIAGAYFVAFTIAMMALFVGVVFFRF